MQIDTTPPVFDFCPSNFTTYTAVGSNTSAVTWALPVASDNTGLTVRLVSNYVSGEVLMVGFTTVQYIGYDTFNNTDICEFTVELLGTCMRAPT